MNAKLVHDAVVAASLAVGLFATAARGDGYRYYYPSAGDSYGYGWHTPVWSDWGYGTDGDNDAWSEYGDYNEVPVYRLASTSGAHMFSVDVNEINALLASGAWVNEGVAFWALSGEYGYKWIYGSGGYSNSGIDEAVPLYRLSSRVNGDYFFTASTAEVDGLLASGCYDYDGITCFVDSEEYGVLYGDPVYRLNSSGQYLFTVSEAEKDALVASGAWTLEGIAFYALSPVVTVTLSDDMLEKVPTTKFQVMRGQWLPDINPPYLNGYVFEGYGWRYYTEGDDGNGRWFYDLEYDACGNAQTTAYGDVWSYALWRSPTEDASLKPVYRVRCAVNGDYLFTLDANERDVLNSFAEWNYEGIAFYAYDDFYPGTTPLYRFTYGPTGEHLFTATEAEKNALGANINWLYDGIVGFVSANPQANTRPVYRFYSPVTGLHVFSSDASEMAGLAAWGWTNEGVAYYVW